MKYIKFVPIAGIFDGKIRARITRVMRNAVLNEGESYGRVGCFNYFLIDRIEKVIDGRVFTLTDSRGCPYVFKVKNGYLIDNIMRGELKTRAELEAQKAAESLHK